MKNMNLKSWITRAAMASLTVVTFSVSVSAAAQETEASGGVRVAVAGIAGVTGARNSSSNTAQGTGINADRKIGYGAGILIEAPFTESLGIETGVLYVRRRFEVGTPGLRITRTVPTVFVPLEARLWLGELFSVSGGAFGAIRVGDQSDKVTMGGSSLATFGSGSRERTEFGMTLAATLNLAAVNKTGFFVEARYNRGFSNASQDGIYDEHIDDLLLLAGLRFDTGK